MAVKSQKQSEEMVIAAPISDTLTTEPAFDRKKLLELTGSLIQETYERVSGDRFRPREGDKERLAYLRTLKEFIALYNSILQGAHVYRYEGLPPGMTDEDRDIERDRLNSIKILDQLMSQRI